MIKYLFFLFFISCSNLPILRSPSSLPEELNFHFVTIKAGNFIMGSPHSEKGRDIDEEQKEIEILQSFQIMKTEVTQYQWAMVMGYNPSYFVSRNICSDFSIVNQIRMCPNFPVESVTYAEIKLFIQKLNELHHTLAYRLPTGAQWEYAARAGQIDPHPLKTLKNYAWYFSNSLTQTWTVAHESKSPNNFGLFDMIGNVWEWVDETYPTDKLEPYYVMRGGSYQGTSDFNRFASKDYGNEKFKDHDVGFRLARD